MVDDHKVQRHNDKSVLLKHTLGRSWFISCSSAMFGPNIWDLFDVSIICMGVCSLWLVSFQNYQWVHIHYSRQIQGRPIQIQINIRQLEDTSCLKQPNQVIRFDFWYCTMIHPIVIPWFKSIHSKTSEWYALAQPRALLVGSLATSKLCMT